VCPRTCKSNELNFLRQQVHYFFNCLDDLIFQLDLLAARSAKDFKSTEFPRQIGKSPELFNPVASCVTFNPVVLLGVGASSGFNDLKSKITSDWGTRSQCIYVFTYFRILSKSCNTSLSVNISFNRFCLLSLKCQRILLLILNFNLFVLNNATRLSKSKASEEMKKLLKIGLVRPSILPSSFSLALKSKARTAERKRSEEDFLAFLISTQSLY